MAGACVVRSDGTFQRVEGNLSNDEWLSSMPRGAYINARTFRRDSLFQFDFHMQKLAKSIALMREKEEEEQDEEEKEEEMGKMKNVSRRRRNLTPPPTAADVESLVKPLMASALARYYAEFPDHAGEVKMCVHVAWGDNPTDFALPPVPPSPLAAFDLTGGAGLVGEGWLGFTTPRTLPAASQSFYLFIRLLSCTTHTTSPIEATTYVSVTRRL